MKRITSILLSVMIVFSLIPSVLAAQSPLSVEYDISCRGTNDIVVPGGSKITVSFTIKNAEGTAFSLSSLENEILYDHNFFEYLPGSEKATICGAKDITYSEGHHCIYVNTINKADFAAEQLVVTFDLLVKETNQGESSIIKSVFYNAADGDGNRLAKANITPVDLKVTIGDSISVHELKYVVDDKTDILNVATDTTINLRPAPSKVGFTFEGWQINNGEIKPAGSEFTVTSDTEIKAVWKEKNSYKITFVTNGGNSVDQVTAYENDVITLNQITSKAGYVFVGWYSDSSLTTKVTSITLTADTTVYAKWSKESTGGGGGGGGGGATTKYTVSFKTTDGIVLDTTQKAEGLTLALSAYTFAKEGYKFEGWYTDKKLTDKVTSVKVDKDITLYAKWIEAPQEQQTGNRPAILTDVHHAYIVGRENNLVAPQENITRAEVATIFFRLLTDEIRNDYYSKDNTFADVNSDDWFNTAISTLTNVGIIAGRSDTQFSPNDFITRAEFATIAARFSKGEYDGDALFSDISGHWAEGYINRAAFLGWIVGDNGLFRPDNFITRAEAMTLTNRVLGRQPESIDDILTDEMIKFTDNADINAWYYLAIQEATNSHDYEMKVDGKHEKWTSLTENPDWSKLEK